MSPPTIVGGYAPRDYELTTDAGARARADARLWRLGAGPAPEDFAREPLASVQEALHRAG